MSLPLLAACGDDAAGPDCEDPASLTVSPAGPVEIAIVGDSAVLRAEVESACGDILQDRVVGWTSTEPSVATVADGVVHARATGATRIAALLGDLRDTVDVVVACDTAVAAVAVAPDTLRFPGPGESRRLTASATTACGRPVEDADFAWSSSQEGIAVVDDSGTVAAVGPGTAWIRAVAGGAADSARVIVEQRGDSAFTVLGVGVAPRPTSDVWIFGDYAYTGSTITSATLCGGSQFPPCETSVYVWDIAGGGTPLLVDSVLLPAIIVNDVKVSADGRLAVATKEGGEPGIVILDLADPAHPRVFASFDQGLENGVHNVWIERIAGRDYVFAAEDGDGGLHIIDVTDPARPARVGQWYAGSSNVHDVYVREGLAFVSHWDAGLIILDVGDGIRGGSPSAPVEVSRIITEGGNVHNAWYWPERRLVFVGEESFSMTDGYGGLHVVDVSDIFAPVEVAGMSLDGSSIHNFWLDEARDILFIAWYWNGVRALDVSGPLEGDLVGQGLELGFASPVGPSGPSFMWSPQLHRGLIYASDVENGIWVLRFER